MLVSVTSTVTSQPDPDTVASLHSNVVYDRPWPNANRGVTFGAVVEAIPDVEPFPVLDLALASGEVLLGREDHRLGEGLGEAAPRFGIADEHVDDRASCGLPAEVCLDDRRRKVGPRKQHRGPIDEHDDRTRVRSAHGGDQFVVRRRQRQRRPVAPFCFIDSGQPDEHDRHGDAACEIGRFA